MSAVRHEPKLAPKGWARTLRQAQGRLWGTGTGPMSVCWFRPISLTCALIMGSGAFALAFERDAGTDDEVQALVASHLVFEVLAQ